MGYRPDVPAGSSGEAAAAPRAIWGWSSTGLVRGWEAQGPAKEETTPDFSTFYFFFLSCIFFSSFFSMLLSLLGSALAAGPLRENEVQRGCYRLLALPGSVKQRQLLISWR